MKNLALELPIEGTSAFIKINIHANLKGSIQPKQYAAMEEAVDGIRDAVEFDELKNFYNLN